MALITIPNTFSAGAVIVASQHNSNFSTIATDYNGNIDNTNISASAAIAYSKLNLATSIVNADVSASAAIVDSKLATISTAGKVSGASFTSLSSTPAGAGIIPVANLGSGSPSSSNFLRGDGSFSTAGAISFVSSTAASAGTFGNITIDSTKQYFVKVVITSLADVVAIRFNADSGANHYGYVVRGFDVAASATNTNSNMAQTEIRLPVAAATTAENYYVDFFIPPQSTTGGKYLYTQGRCWGLAASRGYADFMGVWTNSASVTSFVVFSLNALTLTGTLYLYQVNQS